MNFNKIHNSDISAIRARLQRYELHFGQVSAIILSLIIPKPPRV